MKIKWNDKDADIGFYEMELEFDDGSTRSISVWDYTCPYERKKIEEDRAYARNHPYAFEVSYCHGYSMHEVFDSTHTLEDVKIWAEDYLLDGIIAYYDDMLANLDTAKKRAEWAKQYKEKRKSGGI